MSIEIIAGLSALALAVGFLWARTIITQKPRPPKKKNKLIPDAPIRLSTKHVQENKTPHQDGQYKKLLAKTQGSHEKANRLIEFERRKNPSGSASALAKSALERLEWDMRR